MNRRTRSVPAAFCAGVLAASALLAIAGPLDPPPGPVTSTHKTLSEIEPRIAVNAANTPGDADSVFRIVSPGSYYLTGNVAGEAAKHGVEIVAGGVTLDLMGYSLNGVSGSLNGVIVNASVLDVAVVNGSVRGWGASGVNFQGAANSRLDGLRVSGNASFGIIAGETAVITACSSRANGASGIVAGGGSTVSHCTVRGSQTGFTLGNECTIDHCTAQSNTSHGISAGFGTTVSHCTARLNGGAGFNLSTGNTITDCTAQSNTLDGIRASGESVIRGNACDSNGVGAGVGAGIRATFADNRIEGNSCTRNDTGIDVDQIGSVIIRNTCSGNTVVNWSIVAGNAVGPIVQATTNASTINGSVYAGNLGSTDPSANFTY